jgi:hypothetical protein
MRLRVTRLTAIASAVQQLITSYSYMLLENSDKLLLEDSSLIILEA